MFHLSSPSRRAAWEANVEIIRKHNLEADLGLHTYTLGVNNYADLVDYSEILNRRFSSWCIFRPTKNSTQWWTPSKPKNVTKVLIVIHSVPQLTSNYQPPLVCLKQWHSIEWNTLRLNRLAHKGIRYTNQRSRTMRFMLGFFNNWLTRRTTLRQDWSTRFALRTKLSWLLSETRKHGLQWWSYGLCLPIHQREQWYWYRKQLPISSPNPQMSIQSCRCWCHRYRKFFFGNFYTRNSMNFSSIGIHWYSSTRWKCFTTSHCYSWSNFSCHWCFTLIISTLPIRHLQRTSLLSNSTWSRCLSCWLWQSKRTRLLHRQELMGYIMG